MALLLPCAAHDLLLVLTFPALLSLLSQLIHLRQVTQLYLLSRAPLWGSVMRPSFIMTISLTSVFSTWVALQDTNQAPQVRPVHASVASALGK